MSDDGKKEIFEEFKNDEENWNPENGGWIWAFLILAIAFGGWGRSENPRISELEKKVARLEGQMSMIGGRQYE